jgi:hypothetical protein
MKINLLSFLYMRFFDKIKINKETVTDLVMFILVGLAIGMLIIIL